MKLRNKKTGEIKTTDKVGLLGRNGENVWSTGEYDSLAELNEEWEDYKPKEPLIKDEKIRKAVRVWAEANDIPKDVKLDVFEYLGSGLTAIRYSYKAKTKPYGRCVMMEYISSDEIYASQNERENTIEELCGEEEE